MSRQTGPPLLGVLGLMGFGGHALAAWPGGSRLQGSRLAARADPGGLLLFGLHFPALRLDSVLILL